MGRFNHFVWIAYGILRCVGMRPSGQAAQVVNGVTGTPVTLPCPGVQSHQDVKWFKIDISLTRVLILVRYASGVAFVPANAPDVWRNQISMDNSDLLIHSLRTDRDSGKFVCLDVSNNHERSFNVSIWDRVTDTTIYGYQGEKVTVSAGESITLSCSVSGNPNPPPRYTWKIGDTALVTGASNGVYRLTAEGTMNGETITCTAVNYYINGTILSTDYDNATLNVKFVGPVSITPPSITVIAGDRKTVRLTCSADGNPPVTFTWKKEGTFLNTASVYIIPNTLRSDAGDYECQASNGMTQRSTTVTVTVYYPPDMSVTYDDANRTLMCTPRGVPNKYVFSTWEHRIGGQLIRKLSGTVITSVSQTVAWTSFPTYQDTGIYICTAANGIGGKQSGQTTVKTEVSPVFDSKTEKFVALSMRNRKDIPVSFYSHPKYSNVEWRKYPTNGTLRSHKEMPGPVELFVYNKTATVSGHTSILTLPDASPADEGNYTIRVFNVVNGATQTAEFVLYVKINDSSGDAPGGGSVVGPVVGAVAGVLVFGVVITSVFLWYRRRKHTGSKSDRERDLTTKLQDLPPPHAIGNRDDHELTMVANTQNPGNTTDGKPVKAPCELYGGQEVATQSNNANEEFAPIYTQVDPSRKKRGPNVNEDVVLNYTQVEFPKQKKKKKKLIHRSKPATNYADISFNAGLPQVDED